MSTIIFMFFSTIFIMLSKQVWLIDHVAVMSNGYLAIIVLTSLLINKPFTIEYAKEQVDKALWHNEKFILINSIISTAWLIYFIINFAFNLISTYLYHINTIVIVCVQLVLLWFVIQITKKFPNWYIQRLTINFRA